MMSVGSASKRRARTWIRASLRAMQPSIWTGWVRGGGCPLARMRPWSMVCAPISWTPPYGRMIQWVDSADRFLGRSRTSVLRPSPMRTVTDRRNVGWTANILRGLWGGNVVRHRADKALLDFAAAGDARRLSQQGPAT